MVIICKPDTLDLVLFSLVSELDYVVNTPDWKNTHTQTTQLCHVNMLKEYVDRNEMRTVNH